jgi:hypothetical protein
MIYEFIDDDFGGQLLRATEPSGKVWYVPQDPNNSMYQDYLQTNP